MFAGILIALMVIYNLVYFNAFYFAPDVLAAFVSRDGVLMRFEDKSIVLVKAAGPLPFPVPGQFMVIAG